MAAVEFGLFSLDGEHFVSTFIPLSTDCFPFFLFLFLFSLQLQTVKAGVLLYPSLFVYLLSQMRVCNAKSYQAYKHLLFSNSSSIMNIVVLFCVLL